MINNHKNNGEWKIQLTMQITFISSFDTGEFRIIYSESDHVEIITGIETKDIINELFKSFLKKYHEGLETNMREGSNFFLKVLIYYMIVFIK